MATAVGDRAQCAHDAEVPPSALLEVLGRAVTEANR
jgi:hypothetical protein